MRKNHNPLNEPYNARKRRGWHARRLARGLPTRTVFRDTEDGRECSVCHEVKPVGKFNLYLPNRKPRRECADCERSLQRAYSQKKRDDGRGPDQPRRHQYMGLYRDSEGQRECSICREVKTLTEFALYSRGTPRRQCRECQNLRDAELKTQPHRQAVARACHVRWRSTEAGRLRHVLSENLRRARKLASPGRITPLDIEQMWTDQAGRCAYCAGMLKLGYHIEHKVPLSRGGSNGAENICLSCKTCNHKKHARTDVEFLQLMAG